MNSLTLFRLCSAVWCLAVSTAFESSSAHAGESRRWAFLVGVQDYISLKKLDYSGADIEELAKGLPAIGFDPTRIKVLHDRAEGRYRPLKANIEQELDLLLERIGPDDLVLFAFSGHGLYMDGKTFFCPPEARVNKLETLISEEWLRSRLDESKAALKIVLLDACRSDPRPAGQKAAGGKQYKEEDLKNLWRGFERPPEGTVVLRSCGPEQISWEDPKLGHGVFMNFLLEGMKGQADANKNDKISLEELFEYVHDKTESYVDACHQAFQRPARSGEINGKFEFGIIRLAPPIFDFADGAKSSDEAKASQEAWAKHLKVDVETANGAGIVMRIMPPGKFNMGSPKRSSWDLRKVQVEVTLTKAFYLGTTEVTQKQWESVMGYNPSYYTRKVNDTEVRRQLDSVDTAAFPAECMSWYDMINYCNALSKRDNLASYYSISDVVADKHSPGQIENATVTIAGGKGYRLPTEAEWEYSCRAGTTTPYPFESDSIDKYANIERYFKKCPCEVHSYAANAFGLFDMIGNVEECCWDRFEKDLVGGVDPSGPALKSFVHVARGGHHLNLRSDAQSASRTHMIGRGGGTGFRLARTISP